MSEIIKAGIRPFIVFLLFGFFSVSGFSEMEKRLIVNTKSRSYRQQLIKVDSITHGRVSAEMFYNLPSNDSDEGAIYDFTLIDSLIFLTKRCDFKVWKWSEGKWQDLYKKHNKGWCMANRYIRNRELIGFTADGFWTSQSGLYVFDNKMGSWDLLEAKNSPSDYVSSGDFKIGKDTIVSLYGKKSTSGRGITWWYDGGIWFEFEFAYMDQSKFSNRPSG